MQVNITKRIDTPEGKRYCPVVVGLNGRIKPDWVMVDGHQEKHLEGAYYLDWTEDGTRARVSVGTDAAAAYNCRVRKQRELDALASGLIVSNPIEDDSRLRINSAVGDFLEEIQLSRQRKTWMGYIVSLRYFQESCGKRFLDEVERKDLLRLAAYLRDTKKLSPRTVHNKFADVLTFLQAQGVPKLIGKNDHPRFIEQEVSIYEKEDLSKLHAVCSPYHSTLYDFLLMSGFREQEAMGTPPPGAYAAINRMIAPVTQLHFAFPVLISPPMRRNGPWTAKSDSQDRVLRDQVTLDPATGSVLSRLNFSQRPLVDRLVGIGVAAHEGHLYGWLNQLVNLCTAMGLIVLSISALVLWWRRRPEGVLGAPAPLTKPRFTFGLVALVVALAIYLPLFGLSVLLVLLTERLVLRRLPSARRWLGLPPPALSRS